MGKTFFSAKDRLMSSVMKGIQDLQTMGKTSDHGFLALKTD